MHVAVSFELARFWISLVLFCTSLVATLSIYALILLYYNVDVISFIAFKCEAFVGEMPRFLKVLCPRQHMEIDLVVTP